MPGSPRRVPHSRRARRLRWQRLPTVNRCQRRTREPQPMERPARQPEPAAAIPPRHYHWSPPRPRPAARSVTGLSGRNPHRSARSTNPSRPPRASRRALPSSCLTPRTAHFAIRQLSAEPRVDSAQAGGYDTCRRGGDHLNLIRRAGLATVLIGDRNDNLKRPSGRECVRPRSKKSTAGARRQRSGRNCSVAPLGSSPRNHSPAPDGSPSNTLARTPE